MILNDTNMLTFWRPKVLNWHHWARWPAEGKSILRVFWFLLVTILLGVWLHPPTLQGQQHFQFFIHTTSPLCVLTLFCLFPVQTYVMVSGVIWINQDHSMSKPLIYSHLPKKKKKNAFCKQYNIYGLKGLRLDILEGDIILLAAD